MAATAGPLPVRAARDGIWESAPVPVYPGDIVTLDAAQASWSAAVRNILELVFIDGNRLGLAEHGRLRSDHRHPRVAPASPPRDCATGRLLRPRLPALEG